VALEATSVDFRNRWKASAGQGPTTPRSRRLFAAAVLLAIACVGVAVAAGIVLGPLLTWQTACVTLVIEEYPLGMLEPVPFGEEDREALRTSLSGSLHTSLGDEPVDLVGLDSLQGVRDLLLPRMRGLKLRGKDVMLAYVRGQAFVAPPVFDADGLERPNPLSGVPCLLASDCRIAGERPQEIVPLRTVVEALASSPARTTLVAVDLGDLQWDPRLGVLGHVVPAALDQAFAGPVDDIANQNWVIGSHDLFQMSFASVQARRTCFGRAFELAISGQADEPPIGNGNGLIELDEVARFVSVWTNEWTRRLSGGRSRQTPVVWKLGVGRVPLEDIPAGIPLIRVPTRRSQDVAEEAVEPPAADPPAQVSPDAVQATVAGARADSAVRLVAAVGESDAAQLAFPGEDDAGKPKPDGPAPAPGQAGEAGSQPGGDGQEAAETAAASPAAPAAETSQNSAEPETAAKESPPADGAGPANGTAPPKPAGAGEGQPAARVPPRAAPPQDVWQALASLGQRRLEPAVTGGLPAILPVAGDYAAPWWRNGYAIAASQTSRAAATGPRGERGRASVAAMGTILGEMAVSSADAAVPSGASPAAEQLWAARLAADTTGYFPIWSAAPDDFCRVVAIRNESLATVVSAIDIIGCASGATRTPPLDPSVLLGLSAKIRELNEMLSSGADTVGIDRLTSAARRVNSQRAAIADQLERFVDGTHREQGAGTPVLSRSLAALRSPVISEQSRKRVLQQVFLQPAEGAAVVPLETTGRAMVAVPQVVQVQTFELENIAALTECLPAAVTAACRTTSDELLEQAIAAVQREIATLSNTSESADGALERLVSLGGRVAHLLAGVGSAAATASQSQGRQGILPDRDAGLFRVMDVRDVPQLQTAVVTGLPDWSAENSYGLSLELLTVEAIAVGKPYDLRLAVDSGGVLPAGTEVRFLFDPASLELRLADGTRVAADVPLPVESLGMDGGEVVLKAVATRYAMTPGERVLLEVTWESAERSAVARQMLQLPANRDILLAARQTETGTWQLSRQQSPLSAQLLQADISLPMVPGSLTAWQLALVSEAEIPRDVAVSLYSVGAGSQVSAGPSLGRDVRWQRFVEQFSRGDQLGPPLASIEKVTIPVGEAPVPLMFPAEKPPAGETPSQPPAGTPPAPAMPPEIGPDVAVVIRELTKGEPARQWVHRVRCESLHPRGLLEASAIWREPSRTIDLTFSLSDAWGEELRIPREGVSISIEPLAPEAGGWLQVRRGQTVLSSDRRSDTLVASWSGPSTGTPAMVGVRVNGYPRALVFAVACEPGRDGDMQRPQLDWRMLRIVEPSQGMTVLKAPTTAVPFVLQFDAPPDAGGSDGGSQPTIASLALREVRAGPFPKQPQRLIWVSDADRAVTYAMEKAEPPVTLAIRTSAADWQLELPGDGFVNVNVEAEVTLFLPGNQPPLTTARGFVFDGRPPKVEVPPSVNAVVGRPLVIPAEVVDDPREAFAGAVGQHLPGVSGVDKVEWALDLKGDGKPESWQPAVSTGAAGYEIRLDTKALPVGTRLPLLVRATDRSGLAAAPQRVWIRTAAEIAKGRIEGRVILDGRGEANVPIMVSGPGKIPAVVSGKDGVFVIPDLDAGEYELKAEGVVRNVTHSSDAQKVKVELPPAPVSSLTIELK
jgi:hypothetical protein